MDCSECADVTLGAIGEKVVYHRVFDLFPPTYMCCDVDFSLFSD